MTGGRHSPHNIWFEKVGYVPNICRLQFLTINATTNLKIKIHKIFGVVVLVHAYISKLELNFDGVVGEERWKFDELVPEILYKLVVDVGNPGLQLDRNILKQQMHTFILLQHRFNFNHILILQFPQSR